MAYNKGYQKLAIQLSETALKNHEDCKCDIYLLMIRYIQYKVNTSVIINKFKEK